MFNETDWIPMHQERMLEGLRLAKIDTDIYFESLCTELYKVDLEEVRKDEYSPKFFQVDAKTQ